VVTGKHVFLILINVNNNKRKDFEEFNEMGQLKERIINLINKICD
jgi:hypothetical protein